MILVTLGTQSQKFYRLLDAIENSNIDEEIIVQAGGSSDYESKKMQIMELIPYEEMDKLIDKANIIITHGGTGSVLTPLKKGKKVIACARLAKYKEHINDHQKELVDVFAEEGYLIKFDDGDDFDKMFSKVGKFKPRTYVSNTENFIKNLKEEIDK